MHLLNLIYLSLSHSRSVAPEPNGQNPQDLTLDLFPSGVDYSANFPASPGLSSGGNGFESNQQEIQPPNAVNTAPSYLVGGENIQFGVQSEPETVLLAGKPIKDAPTPTSFGPPIRQNPNVPEEAYDAYPGYPQPSDLPDLYIPVPVQSRITDNPQCIRKQQYCCDSIDSFLNGLSCKVAKSGKKEGEPAAAAAAAADSTPTDGPPPPLAENASKKPENELVAPDAKPFQDTVPPESGGSSWNFLELLPGWTNIWPDSKRFPI